MADETGGSHAFDARRSPAGPAREAGPGISTGGVRNLRPLAGRGSSRRFGPIRSSIGPRSTGTASPWPAWPRCRSRWRNILHALFTNCPNHLFRETVFRASGVSRSRLGHRDPADASEPTTTSSRWRAKAAASAASAAGTRTSRSTSSNTTPPRSPARCPSGWSRGSSRITRGILGTREPLTGHIDVLRREEDGLLGVWDYKPHAAAERNAHIQVFLYALMLSLRTGLPLSAFLCGYFDEKDAYLFSPAEARLVQA